MYLYWLFFLTVILPLLIRKISVIYVQTMHYLCIKERTPWLFNYPDTVFVQNEHTHAGTYVIYIEKCIHVNLHGQYFLNKLCAMHSSMRKIKYFTCNFFSLITVKNHRKPKSKIQIMVVLQPFWLWATLLDMYFRNKR